MLTFLFTFILMNSSRIWSSNRILNPFLIYNTSYYMFLKIIIVKYYTGYSYKKGILFYNWTNTNSKWDTGNVQKARIFNFTPYNGGC